MVSGLGAGGAPPDESQATTNRTPTMMTTRISSPPLKPVAVTDPEMTPPAGQVDSSKARLGVVGEQDVVDAQVQRVRPPGLQIRQVHLGIAGALVGDLEVLLDVRGRRPPG